MEGRPLGKGAPLPPIPPTRAGASVRARSAREAVALGRALQTTGTSKKGAEKRCQS